MKESRRQEIAPNVIVFFDIPHGTGEIYLVVKNVGKSAAENVKLEFQPSLRNSRGTEIGNIHLLMHGAHLIPPEYEMRTFFDMAYAYSRRKSCQNSTKSMFPFTKYQEKRGKKRNSQPIYLHSRV